MTSCKSKQIPIFETTQFRSHLFSSHLMNFNLAFSQIFSSVQINNNNKNLTILNHEKKKKNLVKKGNLQ